MPGHARVADTLAVLAEHYERRAVVGPHHELRRHALVHDVDDGPARRAQPVGNRLVDRRDAQLLGTHCERDAIAGAHARGRRADRRAERSPGADASCEEIADPPDDLGLDDVRRADEAGDEPRRRALVDVFGVADLLDVPVRHHREAVAHHERLLLVVRDVDERDADLALDAHQLELHLLAELEVERAERLVEQQHRGFVDERPRQRDALLLAAGELAGPALVVALELRRGRGSGATRSRISRFGDLLAPQAERDVVEDA